MIWSTSGHSDHPLSYAVGMFGFFHMHEGIHGDGRDCQNFHQRPSLSHHPPLKKCEAGNVRRNFDG